MNYIRSFKIVNYAFKHEKNFKFKDKFIKYRFIKYENEHIYRLLIINNKIIFRIIIIN